jgi:hypothetical protein
MPVHDVSHSGRAESRGEGDEEKEKEEKERWRRLTGGGREAHRARHSDSGDLDMGSSTGRGSPAAVVGYL